MLFSNGQNILAAHKWNEKHNIFVLNIPIEDSIEHYIYHFCKSRNINNCYIDLEKCKNTILRDIKIQLIILNHQLELLVRMLKQKRKIYSSYQSYSNP